MIIVYGPSKGRVLVLFLFFLAVVDRGLENLHFILRQVTQGEVWGFSLRVVKV